MASTLPTVIRAIQLARSFISLLEHGVTGTGILYSRSNWHLPVRAALHDDRAVVKCNDYTALLV
jgi:hypothetical protein